MADLGSIGTSLAGGASIIIIIVIWLMFASMIGIVLYLVYLYTRYNIKFRIYVLTKDRVLEYDDKVRKISKKGKPVRWRLLKRRVDVPPPPTEAFRVTSKGKLSLTAFYTEHGEYKYVREDVQQEKDKLATIESITSDDKAFYEHNYEEAKKWEHRDWTQVVAMITPYIIVFLIFVVFLAFWGKTVAPTLSLSENLISASEKIVAGCINQPQVLNLTG